MFLTLPKPRYSRWRALEQDGHVLAILLQRRRHQAAAKQAFGKVCTGFPYVPRVIGTETN